MMDAIFLYSFFTSKKDINNIKQWFCLVTINSLFSPKRGFLCELTHMWWVESSRSVMPWSAVNYWQCDEWRVVGAWSAVNYWQWNHVISCELLTMKLPLLQRKTSLIREEVCHEVTIIQTSNLFMITEICVYQDSIW